MCMSKNIIVMPPLNYLFVHLFQIPMWIIILWLGTWQCFKPFRPFILIHSFWNFIFICGNIIQNILFHFLQGMLLSQGWETQNNKCFPNFLMHFNYFLLVLFFLKWKKWKKGKQYKHLQAYMLHNVQCVIIQF